MPDLGRAHLCDRQHARDGQRNGCGAVPGRSPLRRRRDRLHRRGSRRRAGNPPPLPDRSPPRQHADDPHDPCRHGSHRALRLHTRRPAARDLSLRSGGARTVRTAGDGAVLPRRALRLGVRSVPDELRHGRSERQPRGMRAALPHGVRLCPARRRFPGKPRKAGGAARAKRQTGGAYRRKSTRQKPSFRDARDLSAEPARHVLGCMDSRNPRFRHRVAENRRQAEAGVLRVRRDEDLPRAPPSSTGCSPARASRTRISRTRQTSRSRTSRCAACVRL